MFPRKSEARGFSLIELAVVVVIIGILLAVALPTFLRMRENADNTAAAGNLRSAYPMAVAYHLENGAFGDAAATTPWAFSGTEDADFPASVNVEIAEGQLLCMSVSVTPDRDAILIAAQEPTTIDEGGEDFEVAEPFAAVYIAPASTCADEEAVAAFLDSDPAPTVFKTIN